MDGIDDGILESDEESMTFSREQIEYLRSEFERQRKWVNLLSNREKSALEELERTQNSVSYKIGRFLTAAPRSIIKILKSSRTKKIVYFVEEDEEQKQKELFPSSLLITPELLPDSSELRKADHLVEEMLITIRRGTVSVNQAKDMFSDGSFSMETNEQLEAANRVIKHMLLTKEYRPSIRNVFVGCLRFLAQVNSASALAFGEAFIDELPDERGIRTLIQVHGKSGNFSRPMELLKQMPRSDWKKEQLQRFTNPSRLLKSGLTQVKRQSISMVPQGRTVLYHASQSMPHTTSGYAIRTHGLVSAIRNHEYNIEPVLRHGYPLDRTDFKGEIVEKQEAIDNVRYNFLSHSMNSSQLINYQEVYNFNMIEKYQQQATDSLLEFAIKKKPAIIHSASNFVVGMVGVKAAKILGIPSIYEIRGFWHLTQSTKRDGYELSDHYALTEQLEIKTAMEADHVFTITNALREILIENGVEGDKISVIPNAVDPEKFEIIPKNVALDKQLNFEGKVVIGYIGSFVNYEGLDLLLEACSILKKKLGDVFRVLLVGDGEMMQSLRRSAQFLQLESIITFTGRVSHDEVSDYYSLIDIAPLPRKGLRVCELVSPLKPFEAMGSGKVLVTSSVQALAEIVQDGETGLIFEKDNSDDLAEKLETVILDAKLRRRLGKNANAWVQETHSWEVISKRVTDVYDKLMEENT
jgi:glycosyltransferase involved in cell wall biosynthesis